MNDEVARALAPQPGGAKPSTTDVLRAIQSAARDSAPSKFLKKMSQPLLEVMDSLVGRYAGIRHTRAQEERAQAWSAVERH